VYSLNLTAKGTLKVTRNFKQFIASEQKEDKQKLVPVSVRCEFKAKFYDYGTPALNKKAKEQIADRIEQILLDELGYIDFEMEDGKEGSAQSSNESFRVTVT